MWGVCYRWTVVNLNTDINYSTLTGFKYSQSHNGAILLKNNVVKCFPHNIYYRKILKSNITPAPFIYKLTDHLPPILTFATLGSLQCPGKTAHNKPNILHNRFPSYFVFVFLEASWTESFWAQHHGTEARSSTCYN